MYYFDHSATTPIHPDVLSLMHSIQKEVYGNPSSIYSQGRKAKAIIENARSQIANAINCESKGIFFTSGGTESNNQVIWSLLGKKKSHVISNSIEHPAIIKVLDKLKEHGLEYDLTTVNEIGRISISELKNYLKKNTGLITVMLANNEIGTIQPIRQIVDLVKEDDILVHSDAVHCLGKMIINIAELGVDFLSLSAHKFYGPKGIGVLYVKNRETLSPLIIGGGQESGLRAGTEDVASIAGLGLAAEIATNNLDNHIKKLLQLETHFKHELKNIFPAAIFNGDKENKLPGLINISFPGFRSDILMTKLDRAHISVSNGSACGSGDIKLSPVLRAMKIKDEINTSTLRFSFGMSNSMTEVNYLLKELNKILNN